MIKNVVFDYGKVLVNWNPYFQFEPFFNDPQKCKHFLEEIVTSEWYRQGDAGAPMYELAAEWGARYPEYASAFRYFIDAFQTSIRGEVPGMFELISGLKARGYRIWGLSNWSWELFQKICPSFPIFSLMDGMVISGQVRMIKPDPAIYHCLLDRYGLKADECVFVDDRSENIDAAIAVGMKGIVFTDAPALAAKLEPLLGE